MEKGQFSNCPVASRSPHQSVCLSCPSGNPLAPNDLCIHLSLPGCFCPAVLGSSYLPASARLFQSCYAQQPTPDKPAALCEWWKVSTHILEQLHLVYSPPGGGSLVFHRGLSVCTSVSKALSSTSTHLRQLWGLSPSFLLFGVYVSEVVCWCSTWAYRCHSETLLWRCFLWRCFCFPLQTEAPEPRAGSWFVPGPAPAIQRAFRTCSINDEWTQRPRRIKLSPGQRQGWNRQTGSDSLCFVAEDPPRCPAVMSYATLSGTHSESCGCLRIDDVLVARAISCVRLRSINRTHSESFTLCFLLPLF